MEMLREKVFAIPRSGRCVVEGHERRDERARGNCPSCYNAHAKLVDDGETTWEELELEGMSLPLLPDKSARARLEEARERRKLKSA